MMKRLLFIMDTFPLGGISKSLLALLNEIEGKYEVDLLLMEKSGLFVPLIPKWVHVIDTPMEAPFRNPHPKGILKAFLELSFRRFIEWCDFSIRCTWGKLVGGLAGQVNAMDVWLGRHTPSIDTHYDAAIAYQGGRCIYYLVEQVDADVKIGYVHNDYSASEVDYIMKPSDSVYFPKLDYLVTISPICLNSLKKEFPLLNEKCLVIENICSKKMILNMALNGERFEDSFEGVRLVTMGRFDIVQKGIDIAVDVCTILVNKGLNVKWYWLGDGSNRKTVEQIISTSGMEEHFVLLGSKTNPYPYIMDAHIYIQPSRFEGKSVALNEVKALEKPIVVTNYSSVNDQFTNGLNALISKIDAVDIAEKIECLIEHPDLREQLSRNLSAEKVSNEEQAEIFESLLT